MDSPSPIISVLTSENSLVKAPCRDLPIELSFCFDFFTFVSIDSFPRSRLSTALPCSPKLASRSGQFLAIKSWISSSLIPPSPLFLPPLLPLAQEQLIYLLLLHVVEPNEPHLGPAFLTINALYHSLVNDPILAPLGATPVSNSKIISCSFLLLFFIFFTLPIFFI